VATLIGNDQAISGRRVGEDQIPVGPYAAAAMQQEQWFPFTQCFDVHLETIEGDRLTTLLQHDCLLSDDAVRDERGARRPRTAPRQAP
jgi:hypothetical protein